MSKRSYYQEALNSLDDAKKQFDKSPIEENYYTDLTSVSLGCGLAYTSVEKAAKAYLILKGGSIPKTATEPEIAKALAEINRSALNMFNDLYLFFHVSASYNGCANSKIVKQYLQIAKNFSELLQPFDDQKREQRKARNSHKKS